MFFRLGIWGMSDRQLHALGGLGPLLELLSGSGGRRIDCARRMHGDLVLNATFV